MKKETESMEVFEAINNRRSIRKYKPSTVPDEHLKRMLEAARLAPSAANRQALAVHDRSKL